MSKILPKSSVRDLTRHAGMSSTDVPSRYVIESLLKTILEQAMPDLRRIAKNKRPNSKHIHIMSSDVLDFLRQKGYPLPLTTTGGKRVQHAAMEE